MTINFCIRRSARRSDYDTQASITLRVRSGREIDIFSVTELTINPNFWDAKKGQVKTLNVPDSLWIPLNKTLRELKEFVEAKINEKGSKKIDKKWVDNTIKLFFRPTKGEKKVDEFFDIFDYFLKVHEISDVRRSNYKVLKRSLQRFELFKRLGKDKNYTLRFQDITADTLREFKDFFKNEHLYYEKYPSIYIDVPESRKPHERGRNTIIDRFNRLHAFFEWCLKNGFTDKQPFENFEIGYCNYGDPIYITKKERNTIMNFDLSLRPKLAIQRDIFIFQSLVGCRIDDYFRLTWDNIQNGVLCYIPHKTKDGNPRTARIPLTKKAKEILERYKDEKRKSLLPFISKQNYNEDIKAIFKACGITRMVTILDTKSGEETQVPINEIASSHMARKTFCGILYKKTKDPNIIGTMSGHAPGSKAFARYRNIDDDILKETISYLE